MLRVKEEISMSNRTDYSNYPGKNFSESKYSGRSGYSDIEYYGSGYQDKRNDEINYYERAAHYNEYDRSGKNTSETTKNSFNEAADKFGKMTILELANNTVFMIIAYLLCWPFAIFLMWKYSRWSQTLKIVLSIICGLFGLGIIIKLIGIFGAFSIIPNLIRHALTFSFFSTFLC